VLGKVGIFSRLAFATERDINFSSKIVELFWKTKGVANSGGLYSQTPHRGNNRANPVPDKQAGSI
jgi:hypothetical protein